jgi:hypothetical protein
MLMTWSDTPVFPWDMKVPPSARLHGHRSLL